MTDAPGALRSQRGTLVGPVRGRIVSPEWAARVVSPLHDVLSEGERRALLGDHPDSYLHVTSDPLVEPAAGEGPVDAAKAAALQRLLDRGAYRCLPEPGFFVYRMLDAGAEHTGVVADVDVAGFADGSVLGHERVQPPRVEALLRHHEHVPLRSELVTLLHRPDPTVAALVATATGTDPLLEFTDVGGIRQTVWRVGAEEAAELAQAFERNRHYIADGHHRVAAALRAWERDGRPRGRAVLCALYAQDQVVLHSFHRRVRGPVDVDGLLRVLGAGFVVRAAAGPAAAPGTIGLYAAGRWLSLAPRERPRPGGVAGLDVTVLDDAVLRPLLGVLEGDPRLEFLPETRALEPTLRGCDDDGGVLFTLCAPSVDDLVSVAERGEVMSAKTTYVKPKPRTGIFLQ